MFGSKVRSMGSGLGRRPAAGRKVVVLLLLWTLVLAACDANGEAPPPDDPEPGETTVPATEPAEPTQLVIDLSNFIQKYILLIIGGVGLLIVVVSILLLLNSPTSSTPAYPLGVDLAAIPDTSVATPNQGQAHINEGTPLLWTVMLGKVTEKEIPQASGGHMRLIIGYNSKTGEILYSDSWGAGHELKRMAADDAWTITTGAMSIEPF